MEQQDLIVQRTENWLKTVVVGCNFCPFAAKPMLQKTIRYKVVEKLDLEQVLTTVFLEIAHLETHDETETTLVILPDASLDFMVYLDMVADIDYLIAKNGYDGQFQVASFHPKYIFEGSNEQDPANYTNRSPYPMLHLLREASLTKVIDAYPDTENIPSRNIHFTQEKGLAYMKSLFESI
jgi:hypothetical protein